MSSLLYRINDFLSPVVVIGTSILLANPQVPNFCLPHAFFEGKKAREACARKVVLARGSRLTNSIGTSI